MRVRPRLMLVTDRGAAGGRDLVEVVAAAVTGGVGLVQVREKDLDDRALRELLGRLQATLPAGVDILVNDRAALADELDLGLHLPSRRIAAAPSAGRRFGVSVHDEAEIAAALAVGAHYLVAGTVFATTCKPGRPGAGPDWIARARDLAGDTPIYAIGGITAANAASVVRAGAHGVAVRSAILEADDPRAAAAELLAALPA